MSNIEDNEILFDKKAETEFIRPSDVTSMNGIINDDTKGLSRVQSPIIKANIEQ